MDGQKLQLVLWIPKRPFAAYPQRAKPAKKASVHWGSRPLMVIPSHSESDILEPRQDNVTCVVALLQ